MIKKTITYTNFNGVTKTEDFYFHISKAELLEMELMANGTLAETLQAIVASNDGARILPEFKKIIRMSFGHRTPDGGFLKRPEFFEAFEASGAYEQLFIEFIQDATSFSEFVNGLVPADLAPGANRAERRAAARRPQDRQQAQGTRPRVTILPVDPPTYEGSEPESTSVFDIDRQEVLSKDEAQQLPREQYQDWAAQGGRIAEEPRALAPTVMADKPVHESEPDLTKLTTEQVAALSDEHYAIWHRQMARARRPKVPLSELQGGTYGRPAFEAEKPQG